MELVRYVEVAQCQVDHGAGERSQPEMGAGLSFVSHFFSLQKRFAHCTALLFHNV